MVIFHLTNRQCVHESILFWTVMSIGGISGYLRLIMVKLITANFQDCPVSTGGGEYKCCGRSMFNL